MQENPSVSFSVATPDQMHDLGVAIGRALAAGDLLLLTGPLGAGKTTLTRGIGEGMGVRGPVTSPTFVLARTHPSLVSGPPLVHVDAYRLGDSDELDDLDIDFEGSAVIAEWGHGIVDTGDRWAELVISRPEAVSVTDSEGQEDWSETPVEPRTLDVALHGAGWDRLIAALSPFISALAAGTENPAQSSQESS